MSEVPLYEDRSHDMATFKWDRGWGLNDDADWRICRKCGATLTNLERPCGYPFIPLPTGDRDGD